MRCYLLICVLTFLTVFQASGGQNAEQASNKKMHILRMVLSHGKKTPKYDYVSSEDDDFGNITVGMSTTWTLGFGAGEFGVTNGDIQQTGSPYYSITSDECSGAYVAPGETCWVEVQFSPTTVGGYWTSSFAIASSWDDGEGDTGTALATYNISGSSFNKPPNCSATAGGSIIGISNQTLGEVVPVVGAPISFYYTTQFAPQYTSTTESLSSVASKYSFNQEGWTNSLQHLYDPNQNRLFLGTGSSQARQYTTLTNGNLMVLNANGDEAYIFSPTGQHLQTQTTLTGAIKYNFGYDANSRLVTITDAFGNVTTFTRDTNGNISQVTSSYGQITTFTVDSSGHFLTITNPNSETYILTYQSGTGLLQTFTKPGGQVSTLTYDSNAKLIEDLGNGGNFWILVAASGNITKSSALNRQSTYGISYGTDGSSSEVSTESSGLSNSYSEHLDNSSSNTNSLQWTTTSTTNDERFGSIYQRAASAQTGIGTQTSTTTYGQTVTYPTGATPAYFNFATLTKTATTSSRAQTEVFNSSTGVKIVTSAAGATTSVTLDSYERPISKQVGSDTATTLSYDSNGRLSGSVQGTTNNQKTYVYNAAGFLQSVTDALSEVTSYIYDLTGRVTSVTLPDSRVIGYTYDSNGNLTSVTPPTTFVHNFTFNAMELTSTYAPPTLTGVSVVNTTYAYNLDKQLTQITQPTGNTVAYNYNTTTGLLSTTVIPTGTFTYSYNTNTPQLASVSSPDGYTNNFFYSGSLLTSESAWSSINYGTTSYAYDTDFRLTSVSEHGTSSTPTYTQSITYNNDSMPTQYGDMALTYTYPSGRLSTRSIGNVSDSWTYDSYGNLSGYTATYTPSGGTAQTLYSYALTRDVLNRITTKAETIQGTTTTWTYSYDAAGRLITVLQNGSAYSSYTYDNNSNRTSGVQAGTSFTATYDSQDRMLTYNTRSFTYDANGTRTQSIYSNGTSSYTYDALGKMKSAAISDSAGDTLSYASDGKNRVAMRTKTGTFKWYMLYDKNSRPLATTGSTGVISRVYAYATGRNVPDYMISSSVSNDLMFITDPVGSPRLIVNTSTGAVSERLDYDDLGNVTNDTNQGFQNFGFAGGLYDYTSGLVNFRARDYDARDGGVWMAKDPILFKGGNTNLYGYTVLDPINNVDPTGLAGQKMSNGDSGGTSSDGPGGSTLSCYETFTQEIARCSKKCSAAEQVTCYANATSAYVQCEENARNANNGGAYSTPFNLSLPFEAPMPAFGF